MNTTFGEFIREIREAKGWSQEECAFRLGYAHRSSMHRLETGTRPWTLDSINAFAGLIGLTAGKLLTAYELNCQN